MLIVVSITCALSIAAAALVLRFILRVHAEVKEVTRANNRLADELKAELEKMNARFASFDADQREQVEWAAQTESLNLNKQGQVLRLHRRGDSALDIARSLQMAPGEVALIVKVHELQKKPQTST